MPTFSHSFSSLFSLLSPLFFLLLPMFVQLLLASIFFSFRTVSIFCTMFLCFFTTFMSRPQYSVCFLCFPYPLCLPVCLCVSLFVVQPIHLLQAAHLQSITPHLCSISTPDLQRAGSSTVMLFSAALLLCIPQFSLCCLSTCFLTAFSLCHSDHFSLVCFLPPSHALLHIILTSTSHAHFLVRLPTSALLCHHPSS